MAITRAALDVLFSGAQGATLASGNGTVISDVFVFNTLTIAAILQIKTITSGAGPVAGDTFSVYIAYSTGDVDGDATEDYDTDKHAQLVMTIQPSLDGSAVGQVSTASRWISPVAAKGRCIIICTGTNQKVMYGNILEVRG